MNAWTRVLAASCVKVTQGHVYIATETVSSAKKHEGLYVGLAQEPNWRSRTGVQGTDFRNFLRRS